MPATDPLVLSVKSSGVRKATADLGRLNKTAKESQKATAALGKTQTTTAKATDRLGKESNDAAKGATKLAKAQDKSAKATTAMAKATGILKVALGGLAILLAPIFAFQKLLGGTLQLGGFKASLKTATGSAEEAAIAFEALKQLTDGTTTSLEENVTAFTKLVNLGLDPSERAIRSYANTAIAMNKSLDQLVEAVLDATVGEFERLKEFGIKARSEGDKVAFTFRGMTTTIGKNAAEIEEFLIGLGENEFGQAMADRMDTVGVKIVTLKDLWAELFRTISELGAGSLIASGFDAAIAGMQTLVDFISSGQIEQAVDLMRVSFQAYFEDVANGINTIQMLMDHSSDQMEEDGVSAWDTILEAALKLPPHVRAVVQRMSVFLATFVTAAKEVGAAFLNIFIETFRGVVSVAQESAGLVANAFKAAIDFRNPVTQAIADFKEIQMAAAESARSISGEFRNGFNALGGVGDALGESLVGIDDELADSIATITEARRASQSLTEQRNAEREAQKKATEDLLGQFRIQPKGAVGGGGSVTGGSKKATGSGPKTVQPKLTEFQQLKDQLLKEEDAIEESFLKRLQLIRENTEAGSDIRFQLVERSREIYEKDSANLAQKLLNDADVEENGYTLAIERLTTFYDERLQVILDNERITEQERTELVTRLTKERASLVSEIEAQHSEARLRVASDFFGSLTRLSGVQNEKAAKVAKASAIAQATIDTYAGANAAFRSQAGIPVIGFNLATAAAAAAIVSGLANVASIASTDVGGFQGGGIIPGSSFQGDQLTARVNSSEMVLNRAQQNRLFQMANGTTQPSGNEPRITVINQTSNRVESSDVRRQSDGSFQVTIRAAADLAKAELTAEVRDGTGSFAPQLQQSLNVKRQGQ